MPSGCVRSKALVEVRNAPAPHRVEPATKMRYAARVRKVLVFQHAAHEILGTLNPMLKERGFRVRYINYDRDPGAQPSVDKYNGLIVLGGHMGVYEADIYSHIKTEMLLIEKALAKGIPILGICLGAQMLAQALGAHVRKHTQREMGWYDVHLTEAGRRDRVFASFGKTEKVFQMHGDTFDIPKSAEHLAFSDICVGQAFRYGHNVYGMQFHLEVDQPMIERWLKNPRNLADLASTKGHCSAAAIETGIEKHLAASMSLSRATFATFLDLFGEIQRRERLGSR